MEERVNKGKNKIGLISATCVVVASMIGTGVFTGLGFQAAGVKSVSALLLLWLISGVVTIFGALTYAELATHMPRSGGEYHYLSKVYHPVIGFMSGWISLTVGFAAPIAVSAMAFGFYVSKVYQMDKEVLATVLIVMLTILNLFGLKTGSRFHNFATIFNVALIVIFIFVGYFFVESHHFQVSFIKQDFSAVMDPAFAVSLIYASFAYSGWNSAAYIAGEVAEPTRNLPKALFFGTLIVLVLYVSLNFVFLYNVPVEELAGKVEIGFIAGMKVFGLAGGKMIALLISFGLVASVNALIITGPRVSQTMGEDYPALQKISINNGFKSPWVAILLQSFLALVLIYTSTFESVITYIGFTINLFTTLTVAGVFIFRLRMKNKTGEKREYKTWGYPLVPIIFIVQQCWMLFYLGKEKSEASLAGLITVAIGILLYFIVRRKNYQKEVINTL
ncbi:MAG: amino acid permease [Sporocytophaga sp.]|uniref:APC family permease n=1 Tax=Sporocytophaga sp. TaxID=2231183 RepID=UPI001B185C66|nr:amino acid permease [Sporocytophaga sp.]MBO9698913.1 amino acid permease [Sporocytophaga sp.]